MKQLHADGELAQADIMEELKPKPNEEKGEDADAADKDRISPNSNLDESYRQSPPLQNVRHLTFAKQDS